MKYSKFDIDSWVRKEHYNIFKDHVQNAFSITAEVDITNLLQWSKDNNIKFYPAIIHKIAFILNKYPEFKMALKDGDLIVYDKIHPNYTIAHDNEKTFSSLYSDYTVDLFEFIKEYQKDINTYGNDLRYSPKGTAPENVFYISALPWISFTSFSIQFSSIHNLFSPIVTMGKYFNKDSKIVIPIAIQLHHAVCDGYHAGLFFKELEILCKI